MIYRGSSANGNNGAGATTLSYDVVVDDVRNRYALAYLLWNNPASPTISSVELGGQAMTQLGLAQGAGIPFSGAFYGLKDAQLGGGGTKSLAIIMSATTEVLSGTTVYLGVDQEEPVSGFSSQGDSGGDFSAVDVDVIADAGGLVVAAMATGVGVTLTPLLMDVQRWNLGAYDYRHAYAERRGTGSVRIEWTQGASAADTIMGIALRATSRPHGVGRSVKVGAGMSRSEWAS